METILSVMAGVTLGLLAFVFIMSGLAEIRLALKLRRYKKAAEELRKYQISYEGFGPDFEDIEERLKEMIEKYQRENGPIQ